MSLEIGIEKKNYYFSWHGATRLLIELKYFLQHKIDFIHKSEFFINFY